MKAPTANPLTDAQACLAQGQSLEAAGTPDALAAAVAAYDRAIARLQAHRPQSPDIISLLAITWMNRGNARQKQADGPRDAVRAYDHALALFAQLPPDDALTNRMGAAWLNRGHALQQSTEPRQRLEAISSTEESIALLSKLPVGENLDYRLNLAGAQANLAQLLIESAAADRCLRASAAVASALELTARHEQQRAGFADIGLKARRTLCQIIGQWLIANDDADRQAKLIASASDAVDTGMTLARHWESLGVTHFRPLTERLFRFGTAFYRRHQIHFLADFVLENLDPNTCSDAITSHPELQSIAREGLQAARHDLRTNHVLVSQDAASERRMQALAHLEAALDLLAPDRLVSAV
ncbi:MAG: hypothetical protein H7A44_06360 [Opitutaceae bacterium]|nr:hypothetical protein [Cephaloticoccus sp.]MCP5530046.1 hypothetical protein [Opitutaceae bacterium]